MSDIAEIDVEEAAANAYALLLPENHHKDSPICGICGENHEYSECSLIQITHNVLNAVVPSRARLTLPTCVGIEKMADEDHCIVAKDFIECGTQFGPLEAQQFFTLDPSIIMPLKLFKSKGGDASEYYLNTCDENNCNWLIFISPAQNVEEQNLICFQEHSQIFYVTVKDITAGEYLKVWYSPYYALKMNRKLLLMQQDTYNTEIETENIMETIELDKLVKSQQKILARESWTCKICGQVERFVPQFAKHIKRHYAEKHLTNTHCDVCHSSFQSPKIYRRHFKVIHGTTPHKRLKKKKTKPEEPILINKDILIGGPLLNNLLNDSMDNSGLLLPHVDLSQLSPALPNSLANENILLDVSLNVDNLLNDNVKELDHFNFDVNDSPDQYVCDICLHPFSELRRFLQHLNKHIGKFTCQRCKKVFCRNENLNAHQCSVPKFACELCDKSFKLRKHLNRHVDSAHNKKFSCKTCGKHNYSQGELKEHNCSAIPDDCKPTFNCTICSRVFLTRKYLSKHLKIHNKDKTPKATRHYVCEICSHVVTTRYGFNHHKKTHAKHFFVCKVCSKKFRRKDSLKNHMRTHSEVRQKEHFCTACNLTFETSRMLSAHQKKHFTKPKLHKCDNCSKAFSQKHSLTKHITKYHNKTCQYCNKNFETETLLQTHLLIHTQKCYECSVCNTKMKLKSSLSRHLKTLHPEYAGIDLSQMNIKPKTSKGTWTDENNDEAGSLISFVQAAVNNEVNTDFDYSNCQSILDNFEDILNSCNSNDTISLLDNGSGSLGKEVDEFTFDDFNIDLQNSIQPTNVQNAQVCLSMPDLIESDQEVTLGEQAYMLDDGTIVEPSDHGNLVVYLTKDN